MPLHPQAAAFVNMLAQQDRPSWQDMPLQEAREGFESLQGVFGERVELYAVADYCLSQDSITPWPEAQSKPESGIHCRVYHPQPGCLPVIVYFHGGGWVLGSIQTHDNLCRKLAATTGHCVVSVEYRVSPEAQYPLPLDDCCSATRGVARFASQLNIEAERIVVAGDSAGGNLALAVAMRFRDTGGPPLAAQVLVYPVVEPNFTTPSYQAFATGHGLTQATMRWFWQQYASNLDSDLAYAKLLNQPLHDLPPTFLLTAEYDVLRDEGELLADKLAEAQIAVKQKRYPGMLHGFFHFSGYFDSAKIAFSDIASYLKSH